MDLKGKTVSFLGDSITEGAWVADKAANRFDNVVGEILGLGKVNNYGIGGTRIAHQTVPSDKARHDLDFCARCFDMDPSSDVIVVFGGTNDYGHGDAPLGKVGDTQRTTFCGSVDYLIRKIRELYPSAVLVMMTPAHRINDALAPEKKKELFGITGQPLKDYVSSMTAIARSYNVPILNLFEQLGIDPNRDEDCRRYTADGLHFNDLGHREIGRLLARFLTEL